MNEPLGLKPKHRHGPRFKPSMADTDDFLVAVHGVKPDNQHPVRGVALFIADGSHVFHPFSKLDMMFASRAIVADIGVVLTSSLCPSS